MKVQCGNFQYEWLEDWASPPQDALGGAGWAHHDLVVTADQRIIGFQSGGDSVVVFDQHGQLIDTWPTGLVEAHGMTLSGPPGHERLWIADPGAKMMPDQIGSYLEYSPRLHGRVASFDLGGKPLDHLPIPALPMYRSGPYSPTAVAVDDRSDAEVSIWVADGYGQSLVHRFSREGELQLTLSGEEGAGRFDCPHYVFIDRRRTEPRLYVADRGNCRLQVYDLAGKFLYEVSEGLASPTALATFGAEMIVAELNSRLAIMNGDDQVVGYLGLDAAAPEREGWPNALAADGRTVRPPDLQPGRFNSPHGLAIDAQGDVYVAEWLIGGRFTRLRRQS